MAGLGTGKAQRYFASDFDRLSNRLFDASEVAVVGVADLARGSAVLHALGQYSNAVLARGKLDLGELHEEARIGSTS
jgi:hypothetical protein